MSPKQVIEFYKQTGQWLIYYGNQLNPNPIEDGLAVMEMRLRFRMYNLKDTCEKQMIQLELKSNRIVRKYGL